MQQHQSNLSIASPALIKDKVYIAARTNFPTPTKCYYPGLTNEEKLARIEEHFTEIMKILELDLDDDSLAKTPARVAKMYLNEIFSGLDLNNFPKTTCIEDKLGHGNARVIQVKNIAFTSFCEHHFVPMNGFVHVAYIPNGKIIGLSKINRTVAFFSKRPQVQERLTAQIADSLKTILNTEHIAVYISAKHYCVAARGATDNESSTSTYELYGDFETNTMIRSEFFSDK